jgi:hypothetical protein
VKAARSLLWPEFTLKTHICGSVATSGRLLPVSVSGSDDFPSIVTWVRSRWRLLISAKSFAQNEILMSTKKTFRQQGSVCQLRDS